METIIVYADDAAYAQPLLQAMAQTPAAAGTHWIVVACAPRVTHRVSKFVSNRARENWRTKWAEKFFRSCLQPLTAAGCRVTSVLARGPLQEVLQDIQAEHGQASTIVDLRRPKSEESVTLVHKSTLHKWAGTLAGMGALCTVFIGEAMAM